MSNYHQDAQDDAREMVLEFIDEVVEQLESTSEASRDLYNDYPNGDRYHHECHIDRYYSLLEAAELLDQLSGHIETDSGMWEGQEPQEAIAIQAAYTYSNAVYFAWTDLIEVINEGYFAWEAEDEEYRDDLNDAIREWIS